MFIINTINLKTIQDLFYSDATLVQKYIKSKFCSIKESEINDISCLVTGLEGVDLINEGVCNSFLCGYTIPNIGKEFDLLRFGTDYIINIELKSTSTEEKAKKQLLRNKYYLKFLNKSLKLYSYISDENKLYILNECNELEVITFGELYNDLYNQKLELGGATKRIDINGKFKLSNYLVSPFNSTAKFIDGEYFLTSQQEEFKYNILKHIESIDVSTYKIIGLEGTAGTGKTLLTLDIAREFVEKEKKVLIVHCGYYNEGHRTLKNELKMDIIEIRNIYSVELHQYDIIIIDESQRIETSQLDMIINSIKENNSALLLCFDPKQCLSKREISRDFKEKIKTHVTIDIFKLSNKIRTNPEVSQFIKCLFNMTKKVDNPKIKNLKNYIKIEYFEKTDDAIGYINYLKKQDWKPIIYTSSQYNKESIKRYSIITHENSHSVIGQEFDNVLIVLDDNFKYEDNKLVSRNTYYDLNSMLFQNITRTREKLCIIIINNPEMFSYCMDILNFYD